MNRIELLAPAGDFESLQGAIANGANAIYLGTTAFSARAFAKNFSLEELNQAVQYAHLRNVRIFVTVNTLYQDDEMKDVLSLIDSLYDLQIDALLIQDIGLLKLVHERYPDMELHTSTQMSIMSLEALRYFEDLGVKRVVLARENTIDEIKYICSHTDLEIEVFAHGALCVGYSGQCLMSSMIGRRSGNRGACAQPCRLPYSLEEDGKIINTSYLMSTMDLCTSDHINEYIEAGVASLKIEGRMKRPEYVAAVTQVYSKAIKHYYDGTPNYTYFIFQPKFPAPTHDEDGSIVFDKPTRKNAFLIKQPSAREYNLYVKQNKNLYVNVGSIQNLEDYKNLKKYNNKKEALKEHDKKIQ